MPLTDAEKAATGVLINEMKKRIGPRSPGMGNPPAYLWEIAMPEGVATVLAITAVQTLRALPLDERMAAMGMKAVEAVVDGDPLWVYVERGDERE